MNKWVALLMAMVVVSCSSIDCPVNSLVRTQYQFTGSDGSVLSLGDTLTVVTARQDGSDTILFNKGVNTSTFHLPISYSHPEDQLVFYFDSESLHLADTLWLKKEDIPHFESVDCNASFFHELTDVRHTHNCLDSVVIINPSVTNDDAVVHVYLYPKTDD
ncbi:MAG: hypothetical protein IJ059_02825 [Prevotella sp.]|nr:hypothetical protein [Prevotella sp.]